MKTLKKFLMYGSWVLLFFIFSQIMIFIAINTTYKYKKVESYSTLITQAEVKATSINGFAKCKVKSGAQNKYIKIDCYSKNDVLMGTKCIKIETNEEQEFEIRFNYSRVDNAKIDIVNEIPQNIDEEQLISDPKMNVAMLISALILLITFG
ncbi:MAG: hypothetical protein HFJ41_05980 [Clostridia bacterium]|nr:hypothetical protein [Clostridia bacterium]